MPEAEKHKRNFSAMFSRKVLIRLAFSVLVSFVVGAVVDLFVHAFHADKRAEIYALQVSAYSSIAQFAPWNVAQRYVEIVFVQGDAVAERLAEQQQQWQAQSRSIACSLHMQLGRDDPCRPLPKPRGLRAFYLSAYVPFFLRPITAFFDVLLHALFDQGIVGFFVVAAQIAIGVLVVRLAIRRHFLAFDAFYSYVLVMPLAVMAFGSIAALPIWLLALIGVTVFKGMPAAGLAAQAGGTVALASTIGARTAEVVGNEAIMKQVERVVGE